MASEPPPMPIGAALAEIYAHASKARRRQFYVVLALMLVGSLSELATIGSVIPFLALLSDGAPPAYLSWPAALLGSRPALTAGFLFVGFALFSGAVRLALTWVTQDFIYKLGHELRSKCSGGCPLAALRLPHRAQHELADLGHRSGRNPGL